MLTNLKHWLVYFLMRIVICIVQAIPIETCHRLSSGLAWIANDVLRIRSRVMNDNVKHAFPELSADQRREFARQAWTHVFLMVCELAHVPRKIHDTNWRDYVSMSSQDIRTFLTYLIGPRPIVVVSGHFGNFEVGGVIAGLLGFPTFTVARPLDNPYLHGFVTQFREATGQFMLPKQGSAQQVDEILRRAGTMMLLCDQSAGPKGCWVDFFGRPASCHKAVALFPLVNQAPMLLAFSRRRRPLRFEIGISAVFDPLKQELGGVREVTEWYNQHLEETIRTAPTQYWWIHDRWKNRPGWNSKIQKRQRLKRRAHRAHVQPPSPMERPGGESSVAAPLDTRSTKERNHDG